MSFLDSTKNKILNSNNYNLLLPLLIFLAFFLSVYLAIQSEEKSTFPEFATDAFTFTAWINAAQTKYAESSQTMPLKSTVTGLGDETLILEITYKNDSYLWTLIVLK